MSSSRSSNRTGNLLAEKRGNRLESRGSSGGDSLGWASCEGRGKLLSFKTSSRSVLVGEADPRQEARNWVFGREWRSHFSF